MKSFILIIIFSLFSGFASGKFYDKFTSVSADNIYVAGSVSYDRAGAAPSTNNDIDYDAKENEKCLNIEDVIIIESGNNLLNYGKNTIQIQQGVIDVANDDCTSASDKGVLSCAANISGNFDSNANHSANEQDCAGNDVNGVWYTFTVSSIIPTFSITGSEFRVYTGADCNYLNSLGCAGDAALTNINDNGDTYWVMVYGSGDFTAQSDDPQPANDECAGVVNLTMDAAAVTGTTTCAEADFTDNGAGCDADVFENAVWYSFTTEADQSKVRLTVTATTATAPIAALILDACSGSPNSLAPTICDATTPTEFCVTPNTTYYLQISTSTANAGEFDIQVETVVAPANDNCSGAIALTPTPSDCWYWGFFGDNTNACPDQVTGDGCDFTGSNMHSVWYLFDTDDNADFLTITTDLPNATLALLDVCGGTVVPSWYTTGGNDFTSWDYWVLPYTTYYLIIGSDTERSNFNIEIMIRNFLNNDDCFDAVDLLPATYDGGTNACANAEYGGNCGLEASYSHEVYYYYTNDNDANVDLEITIWGDYVITGNVATDVSVLVMTDCEGTLYNNTNEFCNTIDNQFTIKCIEDGETIIILVGSINGEEGDFGLTVNEVVSTVDNDECTGAEELTYTSCVWDTYTGSNEFACFEDFIAGSCNYNTEPVVWFKFTAPADATSVEFDNLTTQGTGFMGLFENTGDCDNQTEAAAGSAGLTGSGPFGPFNITGGNTYLIAVGSSGGEGDISFDMKVNESPVNDDPCMADPLPPFDLGSSGFHSGTTCCAVGYNDNPSADLKNQGCNSVSDDNTVWYRASYDSATDGVNINITGGTIGNNVAVEVFVGPDDACTGFEFRKSKCDGLPVEDMHIGCLEDDDYVWIKVTSSDGDCGTFDISVNQLKDCDIADECSDITADQTFDPVTPEDVSVDYICLNGCLDIACTSDISGGCDFSQNPTVWYQVNTDMAAAQLYSTITTSGNWTPIWSVWHPEPDCDNLVNAAGTGSFPCSSESTPPNLSITGIKDNETYYISVTADPNGEPIDNPNFEICVATLKNIVVCFGDDLGCAPDSSLVWEVTNRENTDAEPDGPPYQGPFCPGEELTVHLTFHYDATETRDDWLIGLIPKFGCGWNTDGFDYNANAPIGNGRTADWYEEDGDCPPQMMENVEHLCTYTDEDGHLRLVNTLCELVPEGVTCSDGLEKFDPLPSGYFWVSEGGSPDCDPNNCSPSRKYGIGTPVVDITWDFTMTVKEFDYKDYCLDCNDLSIVFQTFSDEAAGCWDNPVAECLIDKPQWSPQWQVNCQIPPGVVAEPQPQEICTGQEVGILVYTDDGSQETIEIIYDDNPNVDGESEYTFYGGTGNIDNVLTISDPDACDPESVTYYALVVMDDMVCYGKVDTIEVTVYPLPQIKQEQVYGACFEDLPKDLTIQAECGYPGNYTFSWSDDISGNSGEGETIIIDKSFGIGLHTFTITVTDELGCENTGEMQFNVYPPVVFQLAGDTLCWKEVKEFEPTVEDEYNYGNFSYEWTWVPDYGWPGYDETYFISEDDYGDVFIPGEYQLCLSVYQELDDGVICFHDTCVNVWIRKPFNLAIDPDPVYICEGQNCVDVNIIFDEGNGLKFEEVNYIAWNGVETDQPYQEFCDPSYYNDVVVSDIYGCDTTIYFDVLSNTVSELVIIGDTIICAGDTTTLAVVGDFVSYEWNTGDNTKSITVSPTEETTYLVSAENSSGCVSNGSFIVHVFTADIPDIPPTAIFCAGDITTISAPDGYQTYNWYYDNTGGTPVSTTQDVKIDKAGNYIIVVVSAEGCTAQDTVIALEANKLTPFIVGDTSLCFEEDSTLIYAVGGDFVLYQWRHDNATGSLINSDTTQDSIYLSDGTYYLYVSDGLCDGDITFTIHRKPKIEPHILPDVDTIKICYGEDTTLVAPSGFDEYHWSTGSFNDTISNVSEGNYYITVTGADGCIGVDSIYVYVFPRLYPGLRDSIELCADDQAWLSPGQFTNYIWYKDGSHLASFDGMDSILVSDGGIYSVDVFNEIGCTTSDTILVKKTDKLTPAILGIEVLCDDDVIILRSSGTYSKYTWTNSDNKVLGTADSLEFTMTLGKDIDTITLTVESQTGCKASVSTQIFRYLSPELELSDQLIKICGSGSEFGNTILNFNDYFMTGNGNSGNWVDIDSSNVRHNDDWSDVNFDSVVTGNIYRYVFTTNIAQDPCVNKSDTISIKVSKCECDILDMTETIIPVDSCDNNYGAIYALQHDTTGQISKISWEVSQGKISYGQGTNAIIADWSNIDTTQNIFITVRLSNDHCMDSLTYTIKAPFNVLNIDTITTTYQSCGAIIYNKEIDCPNTENFITGWVDHNTGEYFRLTQRNNYFIDTSRDSLSKRTYFVNCTNCNSSNIITYRSVENSINAGCDEYKKLDILLYPNPNTGDFIISMQGKYTGEISYKIYNILGEEISSSIIYKKDQLTKQNIKIDAKSGIYYIRLYDDKGNIYAKPLIIVK